MQTRQTELVITNSTNNLLSYCGSIGARMSDSDKEQPVNMFCWFVTEEVLYRVYTVLNTDELWHSTVNILWNIT